jgi:hypothetical protein
MLLPEMMLLFEFITLGISLRLNLLRRFSFFVLNNRVIEVFNPIFIL